jgi:hypothetical protein
MALTFDAEANIRDGTGTVEDYAHYFKHSPQLTEEDARTRGLLSRAKGKAGWDLGRNASDDLYAAWQAGRVTDEQALAIARVAPGNSNAQQIGLKAALDGKPPDFITNLIHSAISESRGNAETLDLFGKSDAAMTEMQRQASKASKIQRDIRNQISAVSGASKRPELAAKLGVDVNDPEALAARLDHLKFELERWRNWPLYPDLVAQVKGEPFAFEKAESVEEQKTRLAADAEKAKAKAAAEKVQSEASAPLVGAVGDIGQGDLLGGGDLFSAPASNVGPSMGAAQAQENLSAPGTVVSNMFAAIDRDRKAMGKPPMEKAEPRTWDEDNQRALAQMNRDPNWTEDLIKDVLAKPRPLLSWENAGLVWQRATWKAEINNAYGRIAQAFEDGRTGDLAEAKEDAARFEDKLEELDRAVGRGGTGSEAGRTLQAQKMGGGDDFTLIEMRLAERAARGGRHLTPAEDAHVQALYDELTKTHAALQQRLAETAQRESDLQGKLAMAEIAAQAAKEPRFPDIIIKTAEKIVATLDNKANAARERMKARMGTMAAGVDPTVLIDLAEIGASHIAHIGLDFAKWSAAMIGELGDWVKPHLDEVFKAAQDNIDALAPSEKVRRAIKNQTPEQARQTAVERIAENESKGERASVTYQIQKLARMFYAEGIHEREAMVGALHRTLKTVMPNVTRRQVADMFSGYGDYKRLSQDEVSVGLRGMRGELQQLSALEDIESGKPPLKSGIERRSPTDEERRAKKKVNEAKRRLGIVVTNPEVQLRSALDARKTAMRNQISDLEHQITTRQKILKTKTPPPSDAELESLRAQRDKLKSQFDEIFGKPELTDAQKIAQADAVLDRQIAELQRQLETGEIFPSKKGEQPQISTKELDAKRAQVAELKKTREALRESIQPRRSQADVPTPEEIAAKRELSRVNAQIAALEKSLKSGRIFPEKTATPARPSTPEIEAARTKLDQLKKTRESLRESLQPKRDQRTADEIGNSKLRLLLIKKIADYQDRMTRGDYAPRPKPERVIDMETKRLQANWERVKIAYQRGLQKQRLAQRSRWQKIGDAFVKVERAFKLSSPVVFGKLSAAALTRVVTTGTEESVGAVLGQIPGIAEVARQAPREGGINVRAMAKALRQGITEGIQDAVKTAKTGMTDLDVVLGNKGGMDPDWMNLLGQMHGALKAPIKRAEFSLSLEKRLAWNIRNGIDVTDPLVQTRIMTEALNDGYRSIFMQHGFSADMFNQFVGMLEQSKKYPVAGFASAKMLRFLLPIVRVPMNIVGETLTGVHGVPTASARVMFHIVKGDLDRLPHEVSDSIMRQFKKGFIGAGLMAIGYFNPQMVGGYDWRERRRIGAVKTSGFQVDGVDIPRWMTHAPWFELMQIGATIRHVKDQHVMSDTGLGYSEKQSRGVSEGLWAAGLGLVDETPFYGEMVRAAQLSGYPGQRNRFVGELLRGTLVPQAVSQAAAWTDPLGNEPGLKRHPATIGQHVEYGIPGLRENVPVTRSR